MGSNREGSTFTLNKVRKNCLTKSMYVRKRHRGSSRRELEGYDLPEPGVICSLLG